MAKLVAANFYPAESGLSSTQIQTLLKEIAGGKILITGICPSYIQGLAYPDIADDLFSQVTEKGLKVTRLNNKGDPKK